MARDLNPPQNHSGGAYNRLPPVAVASGCDCICTLLPNLCLFFFKVENCPLPSLAGGLCFYFDLRLPLTHASIGRDLRSLPFHARNVSANLAHRARRQPGLTPRWPPSTPGGSPTPAAPSSPTKASPSSSSVGLSRPATRGPLGIPNIW